MVEIEITERARRYGYVFWMKRQDEEMAALLGAKGAVEVTFMGADHGKKNIDWQHRRVSIGWRWTKSLPKSTKVFILNMSKSNRLEIQCR